MEIFQLERVVKHRGEDYVLGPVDIRLGPGEILGVVGPHGAGKTTLLRLLWGFLRPDAGRVRVFGRSPHLEQVWIRTRAGYMAQRPGLRDGMTGTRFLEFMSAFYPTWDWERAYDLANFFDLEIEKRIGSLSPTGRARLGLIAALTHRPRLLVLDEPVSGLDSSVRSTILDLLRRIAVEDKSAIVVSSPAPGDVDRIADTMLALDEGSVVEHDRPGRLLSVGSGRDSPVASNIPRSSGLSLGN